LSILIENFLTPHVCHYYLSAVIQYVSVVLCGMICEARTAIHRYEGGI